MIDQRDPQLDSVLTAAPKEAWRIIFEKLWEIFSSPLTLEHAAQEVTERERNLNDIELLLCSSAWDLWMEFESCVPHAAQSVIDFWNSGLSGKAVLILDGLSPRESPWLLQEAARRGYKIEHAGLRASEIPSDTTSFAKALGFQQRSALENNKAGSGHLLSGARTETFNAAWDYSFDWIASAPSIVLWHHWPDERLHQLDEPGNGFQKLCHEAAQQLTSDSFWRMIEHMATGRQLVITSDHGYAAIGMFTDVTNKDQATWLKATFGSSRSTPGRGTPDHWSPPISLCLPSVHGINLFALGRRKWRSAGGYPTLAHGGLSLLEVAVPFIQFSKA